MSDLISRDALLEELEAQDYYGGFLVRLITNAPTIEADSAELHATAQEYATQNAILMAKNENLEREIAELKAQNSELSASINVLREALERSSKSLEAIDFDWECEHGFHQDKCPNPVCEVKEYWDAIAISKKALASTPELKGKE